MNLIINGKEQIVDKDGLTVTELLALMAVKSPDMVSVQLNGTILKRNEFASTAVKDSDRVNFLYFMGGGAWGEVE